jgi:integrase
MTLTRCSWLRNNSATATARDRCQAASDTTPWDTILHTLRHTHASDMLRANIHPKIVSERLGHASVAITLDVYSHAVPGLQEDAASRMDAALRGVLGQ